jgi:hypothetical protein
MRPTNGFECPIFAGEQAISRFQVTLVRDILWKTCRWIIRHLLGHGNQPLGSPQVAQLTIAKLFPGLVPRIDGK